MRELNGQGHQLRGLVGGITEHQSLVARAARIDTHRDVRRLLRDELNHFHAVRIE